MRERTFLQHTTFFKLSFFVLCSEHFEVLKLAAYYYIIIIIIIILLLLLLSLLLLLLELYT